MKYRRLRNDELQEMEKEFITFLASNSVTSDDWKKLKSEQNDKAEQLIALFSDIVFDKVLDQVEYLEYKAPKDMKTFHFGPDKATMLGVRVEGESRIDFTKNDSPEQMSGQMMMSDAKLKMYRAEKVYQKDRKFEIFGLMENGALISRDGAMYKTLQELAERSV